LGQWDGFSVVPHKFIAEGEIVAAIGDCSGRLKATGKFMSVPFVHVWNVHNGKVARFRQFTDTAIVQSALNAN
jgi:ketosteroid isomerase-like protein